MALSFNHGTKRIIVGSPQNTLDVQDLVNAIREEEESERGVSHDKICDASGKDLLDTGVSVGITLRLLSTWQIEWWAGNYTAKIGGGNLIAESGDPVAYVVGGPQVEITLSAAATIVGGSLTTGDITAAVLTALDTQGYTSPRAVKLDNLDDSVSDAVKAANNAFAVSV